MSRLATALKLTTALAALAVAIPAAAQVEEVQSTEAADAALAAEAEQDNDDGVITVTARRVEETLQTVPGSVSAFNERTLERIQATDTTGLQGAVPNLNIVQGRGSSNATNIFIRGIGQPDALQTFDPAVGVYVDDVYFSRIRGTQLDLLDLERVEVLRGPQGTLYGKNTIGGALKVVTRRPGQIFRAGFSGALGSYDQFELKASASGPVSETVAAGFAVMHATRDGFVEDRVLDRDYNDKNTVAARGALAFTPAENFRFDVSLDYSRDDASLSLGQPINSLTYLLTGTPSLVLPTNPTGYDFTARASPTLPNTTKLRHWGASGIATIDLSDALTLKSISAYRNLRTRDYVDIDATQLQVGDVLVNVDQHQVSQEFQLAYQSERFQSVAGLYYLQEDIISHQEAYGNDVLGPGLTFLRTVDDDLETTSLAAYANASFSLTEALRVSGGIRFTREEKNYFRTTSVLSNFAGGALNSTFPFAPPEGVWEDVSPMASIDYRVGETMAYARYAKGFKSGGFNGRANSVRESTAYDPEEVDSFEVGLKTRIGRSLRLNLAAFHNDYRNFQARVSGMETVNGLPTATLSVVNAGKLKIRGAELEAVLTPVDGLLLDAQIGYLDAEYEEFADIRFPGGSRAFQTPAFAPDWTMRFGGQYMFDLGRSGGITIGGQSRYRSETALAVDNTVIVGNTGTTTRVEGLFQEGYWIHDARIVWEDASRAFSLGLYGQNLGDKAYKTEGQEFSSVSSIRTVYYGAPRTFTVRANIRF